MAAVLRRALLALIIGLGGVLPAAAQDDYEAMPDGEGKDTVYGICTGCHSIKLVMQQGKTRKTWDKTLDWMVEEQGMAELDPETEETVLDYLAEHFNVENATQDTGGNGGVSPFSPVRPLTPSQ